MNDHVDGLVTVKRWMPQGPSHSAAQPIRAADLWVSGATKAARRPGTKKPGLVPGLLSE
jgi:hypothetical protein